MWNNWKYFLTNSIGSRSLCNIQKNIFYNKPKYSVPHHEICLNNGHLMRTVQLRWCSSTQKIYTKTGDGGTSSLYTGERRSKDNECFNALGNVDELSSFIGFAKEIANNRRHVYVEQLERIQCILQDIGTLIATPPPSEKLNPEREERRRQKLRFNPRHITELEDWIDKLSKELPDLSNFILPGGGEVSASLHICRSVCRRAERSMVHLVNQDLIDKQALIYINRLSDYLFTVARGATVIDGKKETIYIRPKPKENEDEILSPNMIKK